MLLDSSVGRDQIERRCRLWPPKALVAGTKAHLLRFISPALRAIPHKFVIGPALPGAVSWSRARSLTPRKEILSCTADTPALITFTSGITRLPKAAVRTHSFLLEQHRVLEQRLRLAPGYLRPAALPIFA